ncbi:MAG TPA: ABC transporter permease [Flavobacteriaceae bacterium]|nr:ABC transporter permease [Flavobacteriaceae bacterium]
MLSLFRENIRIALDSIRSQILRAILTIIIIAIGIWALVGILSAVTALESTISGNFASMGANTFSIRQYSSQIQARRGSEKEKINPIISYSNVRDFIAKYNYPGTQTSVSFRATGAAEVKYGSEKTDPEIQVYGVNEHYLENTGSQLDRGRNFTVFDIQNNNKVCIIGFDFLRGIFKDEDPIDKVISIRGVKFTVIGVIEGKGSTFGNNQDLKVLLPIQVARSIYSEPNINYNLAIRVPNQEMMDVAQDEAVLTFRNIRGLSPSEENDFGIERSDDLINRVASITVYLEIAAWVISIITILGSSIALMNIMLVSVTERTREIGVRKALGAKRSTISAQFFIETIVIGQLGSIVGIILGIITGLAFAKIFNFPFALPITAMVWATIITFVVAIIAGSYPAAKAARLDPVESLRYE